MDKVIWKSLSLNTSSPSIIISGKVNILQRTKLPKWSTEVFSPAQEREQPKIIMKFKYNTGNNRYRESTQIEQYIEVILHWPCLQYQHFKRVCQHFKIISSLQKLGQVFLNSQILLKSMLRHPSNANQIS